MFPREFDLGGDGEQATPESPLEGDAWLFEEIGFGRLTVHPIHLLDAEDLALLDLWLAWRGNGLSAGHLPEAGGVMDQPSYTMTAFRIMDAAESALREKRGDDDLA